MSHQLHSGRPKTSSQRILERQLAAPLLFGRPQRPTSSRRLSNIHTLFVVLGIFQCSQFQTFFSAERRRTGVLPPSDFAKVIQILPKILKIFVLKALVRISNLKSSRTSLGVGVRSFNMLVSLACEARLKALLLMVPFGRLENRAKIRSKLLQFGIYNWRSERCRRTLSESSVYPDAEEFFRCTAKGLQVIRTFADSQNSKPCLLSSFNILGLMTKFQYRKNILEFFYFLLSKRLKKSSEPGESGGAEECRESNRRTEWFPEKVLPQNAARP